MSSVVFRTSLAVEGPTIRATFQGSAESTHYDELSKFMDDLHATVTREGANHVVADLRELEFATSSCLKAFAVWVIDAEEKAAGYTVEFVSNPQHSWQRRSLQALAACAPAVVRVTTS
jgi:hypothetical protein